LAIDSKAHSDKSVGNILEISEKRNSESPRYQSQFFIWLAECIVAADLCASPKRRCQAGGHYFFALVVRSGDDNKRKWFATLTGVRRSAHPALSPACTTNANDAGKISQREIHDAIIIQINSQTAGGLQDHVARREDDLGLRCRSAAIVAPAAKTYSSIRRSRISSSKLIPLRFISTILSSAIPVIVGPTTVISLRSIVALSIPFY
jgi:hypothetical protein